MLLWNDSDLEGGVLFGVFWYMHTVQSNLHIAHG